MRGPFALDWPRALLLVLSLAVLGTVVFAASTSSAAFGAYNPAWDGTSDLRSEADAVGAESDLLLNATRYGSVDPDGSLAIVLSPDEAYGPDDVAQVRAFVRNGGTLLVAEDFGGQSNALLTGVGASTRVDGRLLRDDRHNYRSPAIVVAPKVTASPLTAGVDSLTLNHGTALRPNGATVLVRSSAFSYLDTDRNGEVDGGESLGARPVVTVESVGEGRVVVVSDPSLFVNAMLERPGNQQFVRSVFGRHDRVLLDVSHREKLPPLSYLLFVIRDSPGIQAALGLLAVGAVGAVGNSTAIRRRLRRLVARMTPSGTDRDDVGDVDRPTLDASAVAGYLKERHPGWSEERIERIVRAMGRDDSDSRREEDR